MVVLYMHFGDLIRSLEYAWFEFECLENS